jgi:hypothetical protein
VSDWLLAHMKRFLGVNWFELGRMLHWVRFPMSHEYLNSLRYFVDNKNMRVQVSEELKFSEANIQLAFQNIKSRRISGKIVINI